MNQLVSVQTAADFDGMTFGSLIRTDITLRNGRTAAMLILLTHPQMFDSAVKGVSNGLKSGGLAECWQNRVYTLCNGTARPFVTYNTTYADKFGVAPEKADKLREQIANLSRDYSIIQSAYNRAMDDLVDAHQKIGALRYHLEANGIEIPEHLK